MQPLDRDFQIQTIAEISIQIFLLFYLKQKINAPNEATLCADLMQLVTGCCNYYLKVSESNLNFFVEKSILYGKLTVSKKNGFKLSSKYSTGLLLS